MAEFPQNEWIEVNERLVPLTKPQHYKKGSTTEVELTGHDNPLPTADYGMTESGLWIPKRVSDDGAVHTQLTGSIVEEVAIVNGLALTGTSSSYHTIDIRNYKKIKLYARSTVDSEISLMVRPFPNTLNTTDFWDGERWVNNDDMIIPARTQTFYLNSALPWLDDFIGRGHNFRIRVQAEQTPTQGTLSVFLLGQVR